MLMLNNAKSNELIKIVKNKWKLNLINVMYQTQKLWIKYLLLKILSVCNCTGIDNIHVLMATLLKGLTALKN